MRLATGEDVQVAATLHVASDRLKEQEYSVVVIDQLCAESEPEDADAVVQSLGMAMPLFMNFAISGIDRVVRELRSALQRRQREVLQARQGAEEALRNELKGTVTALLLSCELALQVPGLPPAAEVKLHAVDELAREMRGKLGVS